MLWRASGFRFRTARMGFPWESLRGVDSPAAAAGAALPGARGGLSSITMSRPASSAIACVRAISPSADASVSFFVSGLRSSRCWIFRSLPAARSYVSFRLAAVMVFFVPRPGSTFRAPHRSGAGSIGLTPPPPRTPSGARNFFRASGTACRWATVLCLALRAFCSVAYRCRKRTCDLACCSSSDWRCSELVRLSFCRASSSCAFMTCWWRAIVYMSSPVRATPTRLFLMSWRTAARAAAYFRLRSPTILSGGTSEPRAPAFCRLFSSMAVATHSGLARRLWIGRPRLSFIGGPPASSAAYADGARKGPALAFPSARPAASSVVVGGSRIRNGGGAGAAAPSAHRSVSSQPAGWPARRGNPRNPPPRSHARAVRTCPHDLHPARRVDRAARGGQLDGDLRHLLGVPRRGEDRVREEPGLEQPHRARPGAGRGEVPGRPRGEGHFALLLQPAPREEARPVLPLVAEVAPTLVDGRHRGPRAPDRPPGGVPGARPPLVKGHPALCFWAVFSCVGGIHIDPRVQGVQGRGGGPDSSGGLSRRDLATESTPAERPRPETPRPAAPWW